MKLQIAQRKRAKIKMALQGPSGSGKTYSSLLIAFGLCNDWSKIAVIDSENHSSELYSHLGNYNVIQLDGPHSPEIYKQAIEICENEGMEVIILDSLTHAWEYLLDFHSSLQGNSFTNWAKVTPRHNGLVNKILESPCHIISTIRTKQDYVLSEKNGKVVPEKIGLKTVQRDGLEYEFTLVFDLNIKNHATASKDRTNLFFGKSEHKLSSETGRLIKDWCNNNESFSLEEISKRICEINSVAELYLLYNQFPEFQMILKPEFEKQRTRIMIKQEIKTKLIHTSNFNNGK